MGYKVQRMMEGRTQQTADDTHDHTEDAPSEENPGILFRTLKLIQPGHITSPLSVINDISF
jgi:hypothetical protein